MVGFGSSKLRYDCKEKQNGPRHASLEVVWTVAGDSLQLRLDRGRQVERKVGPGRQFENDCVRCAGPF